MKNQPVYFPSYSTDLRAQKRTWGLKKILKILFHSALAGLGSGKEGQFHVFGFRPADRGILQNSGVFTSRKHAVPQHAKAERGLSQNKPPNKTFTQMLEVYFQPPVENRETNKYKKDRCEAEYKAKQKVVAVVVLKGMTCVISGPSMSVCVC